MRKVLLTTSAIVGLTAPVFAADPTAVSDQPYFHHAHPMTWSGSMSISLTNLSNNDANDAVLKGAKKEFMFAELLDGVTPNNAAANSAVDTEERFVATMITNQDLANAGSDLTDAERNAIADAHLLAMKNELELHTSYTTVTITNSSVEDIIDDYFGGSHSEAMDVMVEIIGNGDTPGGSDFADVTDDLRAFQAAQDAGVEGVETTSSINTSASLGVSMAAGDGWTARTSGSINLGAGSVSGGALSLSNGTLTVAVGKSQHSAASAVSTVFGMDRSLNTNSADTVLSATMAMGGATISVDNEMDGDNLEMQGQTIGIKGSYGTMSYGLGWEAEGDVGFSIGTNLGGMGLTISRVNTGSTYSMGLGASVDLGGGMKLSATNAQNSDGLTDVNFNYGAISATSFGDATLSAATDSIGTVLQVRTVHKSISTVGLSYAGGGTSVGITYQEKAGTSATGDNMIASGSMAISPSITLSGSYNKDSAVTTIGASGPLGSAGTLSAAMRSTGSSSLTASFKF
jgi:hypothetical protein